MGVEQVSNWLSHLGSQSSLGGILRVQFDVLILSMQLSPAAAAIAVGLLGCVAGKELLQALHRGLIPWRVPALNKEAGSSPDHTLVTVLVSLRAALLATSPSLSHPLQCVQEVRPGIDGWTPHLRPIIIHDNHPAESLPCLLYGLSTPPSMHS